MSSDISVIIPCYNGRDTLGRALESLMRQTYQSWEAVVVDDGSNPPVELTLEERASGKIRLVRHDHNRGVAVAQNTGVQAARGHWVTRLDADDTMPSQALEQLAHAASAGGDIAWGGHRVIPGNAVVMPPVSANLNDLAICVDNFALWGKLIRRSLLLENPAWEGLDCWEDIGILARILARKPKVACVEAPVYIHHVAPRGRSLSTADQQRVLSDHLAIARLVDRWMHSKGVAKEYSTFLDHLKFAAKVKLLRCKPRRPKEWRATFPEVNDKIMQLHHVPLKYRLFFKIFTVKGFKG